MIVIVFVILIISRYCGKQSGLYPRDDDWAAAKIDEIIDTATDITVMTMMMVILQSSEL